MNNPVVSYPRVYCEGRNSHSSQSSIGRSRSLWRTGGAGAGAVVAVAVAAPPLAWSPPLALAWAAAWALVSSWRVGGGGGRARVMACAQKKSGHTFRVGIFLDFVRVTTRTMHPHEAYVRGATRNRIDPHGGGIERLAARTRWSSVSCGSKISRLYLSAGGASSKENRGWPSVRFRLAPRTR